MSNESHVENIARRKAKAPNEWRLCAWERIGDDGMVVKGGVPRLLTRGKNKGLPTWKNSLITKVVVTDAEIQQEHANYESATGLCGDCFGTGEVFAKWSIGEGVTMRTCPRCGGDKKAPAP
jgi:hypothetical protein